MVTSTSNPDGQPPSADPIPRREVLATVAAQIAALDEMIRLARRSVRVFDIDLSGMGWNRAERSDAIATFARTRPNASMQIIVHETRWIESYCPRLTQLLRHYGHAITIRRTGPDAHAVMDPIAIVDDRHFLHRFHGDQPKAEFGIEQPQAARPFVERFDELWATGEPGLGATVLGL